MDSVWHRAKDRADASQASKRSPIGDPPHLGTSAATARSAKAEIAESEYCSRFPYAIHRDDIEFRVFLANLECSLKFGRIAPTLKRLHACPPKDHDRPLRQVSRKPRSWSC